MQSYPVHELLGYVKLPDKVVERPLHGESQLATRDVRVRAEIKLGVVYPGEHVVNDPVPGTDRCVHVLALPAQLHEIVHAFGSLCGLSGRPGAAMLLVRLPVVVVLHPLVIGRVRARSDQRSRSRRETSLRRATPARLNACAA